MEKRKGTAVGTPHIKSIHSKSFIKSLTFENLFEKGSLAPLHHKVIRFSTVVTVTSLQFREKSLDLKAEIHHFNCVYIYKKKRESSPPNLQLSKAH